MTFCFPQCPITQKRFEKVVVSKNRRDVDIAIEGKILDGVGKQAMSVESVRKIGGMAEGRKHRLCSRSIVFTKSIILDITE